MSRPPKFINSPGVLANKAKPCAACSNSLRMSIGHLCVTCYGHLRLYGDPLAQKILLRDIPEEIEIAATLVFRNMHHPAVKQWKATFIEWVKRSCFDWKLIAGGLFLSKFNPDGRDALKVLQICLALFLRFYVYHDYRFNNSVAALYFTMVEHGIVGFHKNATGERESMNYTLRQELALSIQRSLGGLLAAFRETAEKQARYTENQQKKLKETPLQ